MSSTNPTPPTGKPTTPPKPPSEAQKKAKPDLWTQVMVYGLIAGLLESYQIEVTQTASAMKAMLDNYFDKQKQIAAEIQYRTDEHDRRVKDDPKNPNADPSYEGDMQALQTERTQVQNQIQQVEATLNGVLQAAANNIKYAMSTVTDIGQELSRVVSGMAGG